MTEINRTRAQLKRLFQERMEAGPVMIDGKVKPRPIGPDEVRLRERLRELVEAETENVEKQQELRRSGLVKILGVAKLTPAEMEALELGVR